MIFFFKKALVFILLASSLAFKHLNVSKGLLRPISISHLNQDLELAFMSSFPIMGRSDKIWRFDIHGQVILNHTFYNQGPLSFGAIRNLYGGMQATKTGNTQSLDLSNGQLHVILNIIELALNGYITNAYGYSACWTPSNIHIDLDMADINAQSWHRMVSCSETKYGWRSHELIFAEQDVHLNRSPWTPYILGYYNMRADSLYHCSDITRSLEYIEFDDVDEAELKENWNIYHNWGLPIISSFIDEYTESSDDSISKSTPIYFSTVRHW